ncbi:MAG TPA: hypothetical protein VE262_08575 [Blastocatellia bacterium]|nr:hypothetical protein [Blastocatellia bacterium]
MKCISVVSRFFLLIGILVLIQVQARADSCEIDLQNNSHNCQNIAAISFISGPNNKQVVFSISLDPDGSGFREAIFDVEYKQKGTGWTVNIGDSISNNGFAGDFSDQSNDAELQILDGLLSVYGSDFIPPDVRLLLTYSPVVEKKRSSIRLRIKNQSLTWQYNGQQGGVSSPYLYALNGQSDDEGTVNYNTYAAFNRTISSSGREGSGVKRIKIELK